MCFSSTDPMLMLLQSFTEVFTRPTFSHVLLLVCGTLLAQDDELSQQPCERLGKGRSAISRPTSASSTGRSGHHSH